MSYIVIKTEKNATHKDAEDNLVLIKEVVGKGKLESNNAILVEDISAYIPLQPFLAKQSSDLEKVKKDAIDYLERQLNKKLSVGVVVGDLTLLAGKEDIAAFANGTVLLGTAESLATDKDAFGSSMISSVFGRGVVDSTGAIHDMTVNEYKQLMVDYGKAIGIAQAETLEKIAQVNGSDTKEAIDAILGKKKVDKEKKLQMRRAKLAERLAAKKA